MIPAAPLPPWEVAEWSRPEYDAAIEPMYPRWETDSTGGPYLLLYDDGEFYGSNNLPLSVLLALVAYRDAMHARSTP